MPWSTSRACFGGLLDEFDPEPVGQCRLQQDRPAPSSRDLPQRYAEMRPQPRFVRPQRLHLDGHSDNSALVPGKKLGNRAASKKLAELEAVLGRA